MNTPISQHVVPKTYLKKFAVDPTSRKAKSLIECLRISPERKLETKSVNSKFFKIDNFYTHGKENQYQYENYFSKQIEPTYNNTIDKLNSNAPLDSDTMLELLHWIFISKYRNTHFRDTLEQLSDFAEKWGGNLQRELSETDKHHFIRNEHLEFLTDPNQFKRFCDGMFRKDFLILSPCESLKFISNDNPGFSIDIVNSKPNILTLNVNFATNPRASNFYPLSHNKYLAIIPPLDDRIDEKDCYNILFEHRDIGVDFVTFLNDMTFKLVRKYCIANNTKLLEPYLNTDLAEDDDFSNLPIFKIGGRLKKEKPRKKNI